MSRRFLFLKKKYSVAIVFMIFVSWIIVIAPYNLMILLLGTFFLWLNRKKAITWKDSLKNDGSILLSPVDGEIVRISQFIDPEDSVEYTEIRIKMSVTNYWGVHLPNSSEMEYLKSNRGKFLNREQIEDFDLSEIEDYCKTDLTLRSKNDNATKMRFLHCIYGKSPKIWMKSGDRGRGAACFGYYPFGGSLLVYISRPSDILVIKGEKIEAGQTVLAVFKNSHED
jgi:phosphatidylserine decarboxylase